MRHLPSLTFLPFLLPGSVQAITGGTFENVGDSLVSAMMMFLGGNKVYIIDKAEANLAKVAGHPSWGSVWDFDTHETTVMDIKTNTFCSSGYHLPNGSFATFGGNGAAGPGGKMGDQVYPGGFSAMWDTTIQDFDGTKSIRILNPCSGSDDFSSAQCQWFDDPATLSLKRQRWYSAAEATGDGTIVIIGGFQNGGYIARNYPNNDPTSGAELTYEFFPPTNEDPQKLDFLFKTSGLNAYPHTFLLSSGKMFLQANISTMIWDYTTNTETDLPNMPNDVVRVYPASGATAMLPLTPANNYQQTLIFCGGTSGFDDSTWGNFSYPYIDPWNVPTSKDCQRITPEPTDGSAAAYVPDDDMLEGRTMGQFIIMPDGKLLVVNGASNGTAGFGDRTLLSPQGQMPFGESYASGPVGTPAIYDPNASRGSRWSNAGLATSSIARLYHSSAILLPDASVLIAGSNPNLDVDTSSTIIYPTEYRLEKFYPPYFSAATRPTPSGVPSKLSYGGDPFDITVPASSYSGSGNDAANQTIVSVVRGGWTTHGMNMGQRFLQLDHSYTVNKDGSIILHVSQMPPNPNLFQPGPALLFVVVNGIPSNGTHVIIGSGAVEKQPTAASSKLPASILADASGTADKSSTSAGTTDSNPTAKPSGSGTSHTALIAGIAGGAAVLALLAVGIAVCLSRRRRARLRERIAASKAAQGPFPAAPYQKAAPAPFTESQVFLTDHNESPWNQPDHTWNQSNPTIGGYTDRDSGGDMTPVSAHPVSHYNTGSTQYDYQQQQHRY